MAGEKIMSGNARFTLDGKTVYHATTCSLSFTRETKERATKDIEGKELAKGIKSFSASISSLVTYNGDGTKTNDFGDLFDMYNDDSDAKITLVFTPDEADTAATPTGTDSTYTLTGDGIITDLSGDFANEEDGSSSMTIAGGAMVKEVIAAFA